jgi:mono/diheme cytochrome c family protein
MNLSRLAMIAIASGALITACSNTDQVTTVTPQSSPVASPAVQATPDEFAAARATFAKECAVCHGDTGEGKTAVIEGKKIKAPPLRTGHALKHSDVDFVKQISKGGDGMPAFEKKMTPKEIEDMVRFIRKEFQGGNQPTAKP